MPLPKVRAVGEDEVFKVLRTGKRKSKFSVLLTITNDIISILLLSSLIRKELEADGHQGYICG